MPPTAFAPDTPKRDWRDRGLDIGKDRVRSMTPDVSKATDDAGRYVSQAVRENPMSGLLVAAALGGVLGYLLRSRPS
jgi:ElaB/YqjD/DUF883 family membrane-anchored ribosome-binding protein